MIKILKPGIVNFKAVCEVCGCEFRYTAEDVEDLEVECPCCGQPVVHDTPESNDDDEDEELP